MNNVTMPYMGRWSDDVRLEMIREIVGRKAPVVQADADMVTKVVNALARVVGRRRKSVVPGLGTFEWKARRGRIPTGEVKKGWRLTFHLTRGEHNYRGRK